MQHNSELTLPSLHSYSEKSCTSQLPALGKKDSEGKKAKSAFQTSCNDKPSGAAAFLQIDGRSLELSKSETHFYLWRSRAGLGLLRVVLLLVVVVFKSDLI